MPGRQQDGRKPFGSTPGIWYVKNKCREHIYTFYNKSRSVE